MVLKWLKRLWRPAPRVGYFDIFDPAQMRPVLDRFGVPRPDPDAAGDEYPPDRIRRIYEGRVDLRDAFPLALTPLGRGGFLTWLLEHGRPEYGLKTSEVMWGIYDQAVQRGEGFADAYRWQPAWQAAVPDALTPAGWPKLLAWLDRTHGPFGPWIHRVTPPEFPAVAAQGVNVLGYFRFPCGLQEVAVQYGRAAEFAGYAVARRDLPTGYDARNHPGPPTAERFDDLEPYPVSLVVVGAAQSLDGAYRQAGLHPRPGVHRIACWAWELASFPAASIAHAALADEVWTLTEFSANAVRAAWPGKPVTAMLPAVAVPSTAGFPRAHFGLDAGRFVVVFAFDMGSCGERKNPLGLLRAFRRAFPGDEAVTLVVKVSRGESNPALWDALQAAAAEDARVTLIDRVMPRDEAMGLLACCDCYASLHRAEGLGYALAEAMLLGKPTVATGYSGNLDFMTPETSHLVRYTLVKVGPGVPPYDADAEWAEPDEAHAAELLARVYADPEAAQAMGARAAVHARGLFSVEATAARVKGVLASQER